MPMELSYKNTCISKKIYTKSLKQKSRGVCETRQYAPGGNKVEAIFSFKVKVKVTRSLTLVSFERASLVE